MNSNDEKKLNRALNEAIDSDTAGLDFFADFDPSKPDISIIYAAVNEKEDKSLTTKGSPRRVIARRRFFKTGFAAVAACLVISISSFAYLGGFDLASLGISNLVNPATDKQDQSQNGITRADSGKDTDTNAGMTKAPEEDKQVGMTKAPEEEKQSGMTKAPEEEESVDTREKQSDGEAIDGEAPDSETPDDNSSVGSAPPLEENEAPSEASEASPAPPVGDAPIIVEESNQEMRDAEVDKDKLGEEKSGKGLICGILALLAGLLLAALVFIARGLRETALGLLWRSRILRIAAATISCLLAVLGAYLLVSYFLLR